MSNTVNPLDLLGDMAENLTGERSTTEQTQAPAKPEESSGLPWEYVESFEAIFRSVGIEITDDMTPEAVGQASEYVVENMDYWYKEAQKYKERCKELKAELQAMRETYGKLPKEKKQGGRKKKVVDWRKYDLLKQAGMSEKEIAEYMHIGASTLRRCRHERNQNGGGN